MKELPILFTGEMVKAILEGKKTQTRRVLTPQPPYVREAALSKTGFDDGHGREIKLRYQPGDRLWVRERHTFGECGDTWVDVHYPDDAVFRATVDEDTAERAWAWVEDREVDGDGGDNWRPSIHMPRWASRIMLEVVDVRLQELHAINEDDAKAEGVDFLLSDGSSLVNGFAATGTDQPQRLAFSVLWDHINAKRGYGWEVNPFVWAITFKRVEA